MKKKIDYAYNEPKILKELSDYVDATYDQRYVGRDNLQCGQVWESIGIGKEAYQAAIIKYAMRFGKKGGNNPADLKKIMHYTMMLYNEVFLRGKK